MHLLDKRSTRALLVALMIHDNSTDRMALLLATHHSNLEPEKRLPHPRKAAGAQITQSLHGEDPLEGKSGASSRGNSSSNSHRSACLFCRQYAPGLSWPGRASGAATLNKLKCSKQAYALYTLAWDNIIGFRSYSGQSGAFVFHSQRLNSWIYERRTTAKAFAKDVFINQERKLGARRRSDTVLVSTINDADQGSADVAIRTPLAPY
ncbi:hypothetical protein YC2023_108517 [Brassica napus]